MIGVGDAVEEKIPGLITAGRFPVNEGSFGQCHKITCGHPENGRNLVERFQFRGGLVPFELGNDGNGNPGALCEFGEGESLPFAQLTLVHIGAAGKARPLPQMTATCASSASAKGPRRPSRS